MAFQTGTAANYRDLMTQLNTFLTTNATLVAAGQNWTQMRYVDGGTTQELILKAPGLAGTDQIYVGMRSFENIASDYFNWTLNGYTGYDGAQTFWGQPGSIGANDTVLPCLNLWNSTIPYWFVADGRRCIITVRINTRYYTAYLGLTTPYANPAMYPYPLCIMGNQPGNQATRWSSVNSGRYVLSLRGAVWGYPTAWPTKTVQILPTDDNVYMLTPIVLGNLSLNSGANRYEGTYYGEMDGLSYVPGLSNVSENVIALTELFSGAVGVNPLRCAYDSTQNAVWVSSFGANTELVTNGTFAANITGWTNTSAAGGSIAWNAAGAMDLVFTTGNGNAQQAVTTVVGKTYRISATKGGTTLGLNVGSTAGGSDLYVGAHNATDISATFVATTTTTYITCYRAVVGTGTVDNISVKRVYEVSKVNAVTGALIGEYPTAIQNYGLCYDVTQNAIWTCDYQSNVVVKVNAATGAVIGSYATVAAPTDVCFDPTQNSVWVVGAAASVTKLNASTGALIGTYAIGASGLCCKFDSTQNCVWITCNAINSVKKVDAATGAVLGTYSVGTGPRDVAYDSGQNAVWVSNFTSGNVTKLNAATGALIGTYATGTQPIGVLYDPVQNAVWMANYGSGNITKFNAATGVVIGTYPSAVGAWGLAYDSAQNAVWNATYTSGLLKKYNAANGISDNLVVQDGSLTGLNDYWAMRLA